MLRTDHVCFDCKFNANDELCMFCIDKGIKEDKCEKRCKHKAECLYWNPRRPKYSRRLAYE